MPSDSLESITLTDLRRRRSYKWRAFPDDVLPAFLAEMDFPLAEPVAKAIAEAVVRGDCGYAWPDEELARALSGFAGRRFGWDLNPSDVTLVPDVLVGITELLLRAVNPGTGVVINTPVYPPFFLHVAEAGCRVVEAPLSLGTAGYELDFDSIERAFASGARVYLLCNPHNPTGRVFARDELARVAELAEQYDVLVISDEIHAPLVLAGAQHVPFLSLGEPAISRGVALISASKGWNIPGLKCAQVIAASDPMRALVGCLPLELVFKTGSLGIIANTAAYRDGDAWLDKVLAALDSKRRLFAELLAHQLPAVRYLPPQGGYLAWLDCRCLGISQEPVDLFLTRGRVALGRGPEFGALGTGHARVTLATTDKILEEIVSRMSASLA